MIFPIAASIPYLVFFYILLILVFFKKIKSTLQWQSILLILLFILFYSYNGEFSDWRAYKTMTENCSCLGCTYFEVGYDALTFIASQTIGFYLIPFISLSLIFLSIQKFKQITQSNVQFFILMISIIFVFLPLYYGALRQAISFCFLLFAFIDFYNKKYFQSSFFVFIAITFHLSALIIFIVYLIYFLVYKISRNNIKVYFVLVLISYVIGIYVLNMVADYLRLIDSINPDVVAVGEDLTGLKKYLLPSERILILIMSFYILLKTKEEKFFSYISILGIAGAVFYLLFYNFSINTAGRVVAFFRWADLLIIYYFFKLLLVSRWKKSLKIPNEKLNNIALLGILFYSIIKFYFTIITAGYYR